MSEVKAHEVENYLKKPNAAHQIILIYGSDRGLVYERTNQLAEQFAKQFNIDINDPFATIKLESESLAQDPVRLNDEANTVSMFGGKRLIWVKRGSDKIITKTIQSLLDNPPADTFILIEADELRKGTALRKSIEQAKSAIALPCYSDSQQTIDSLINREIKKYKLTIENQARQLLKTLLGEDRLASISEINKLCLYAMQDNEINSEHVMAIVGDASSLVIDNAIDAVATGNIAQTDRDIRRLLARGTSPVQIALLAQRHFQSLHRANIHMKTEKCSADKAIFAMRPPIHFQRKAAFIKALSIWSHTSLAPILQRLQKLSLQTRQKPELAAAHLTNNFLAIALHARRAYR